MSVFPKSELFHIREVWSDNLEAEFHLIRDIVDDYPYIAMDTEFPGVVLRVIGNFKSNSEYAYHNMKFNFREFNLDEDVYAQDSIKLLSQSGIDFKMNKEKGVDVKRFSELLMPSGIVLNSNVHWVTFHSLYDFGYLVKLLTCKDLPDTQADFFELIKMYFPVLYDIKYLMKFCNGLHGGLNKLAELLEVPRIGACHQGGSDSLVTCCTFMKVREKFFEGSLEKYAGVLFGLGVDDGQITQ
ncbi:Ribonuclease CAF1 [Melia azedarach]|uniref:Ribonuclease CAF1 n=1 Tax=Melia azedarach TaxID=155640 RepID=A0ACC1XE89_MELAZ|nr:Ribonuclease CAF1 [Melia azedarach]